MYKIDYARPTELSEALEILKTDVEPRLLAGGQTLLPAMKHGLTAHSILIDLQAIDALRGIELVDNAVRIGAMTSHAEIAQSNTVRTNLPSLCLMANGIADPLVRSMGTLGGSVANNDPASDYPAAVLGSGATIHTNLRDIAADDFFVGMFATALDPHEILTSISFPIPVAAGYFKLPHPASGYVLAGAFVSRTSNQTRVAIAGAGACVFRDETSEFILSENFHPDQVDKLSFDPEEFAEDMHADQNYRANVLPSVIKHAVGCALNN